MRLKRFTREIAMLRWSKPVTTIVVMISISGALSANDYLCQDDDLLCSGGNAQERLQQRIQQHAYQQSAMYFENQRAMAYQAAAEQKSLEMTKLARRNRFEKEARKREEAIAKRKAQNLSLPTKVQTAGKTLKPSR
jgi:hypothetical protein